MSNYFRGEIYYIERYQNAGSEQQAGRPAVIVSNDMCNNYSPVVEVVYLTTQPKNDLPTHVRINSGKKPSTVLCERVTSVTKDRIGDYVGKVTDEELRWLDAALMVSLALDGEVPEVDATLEAENEELRAKLAEAEKQVAELNAPVCIKAAEPFAAITPDYGRITMEPDPAVQTAELAGLKAERDIYKRLYEEMLERAFTAKGA